MTRIFECYAMLSYPGNNRKIKRNPRHPRYLRLKNQIFIVFLQAIEIDIKK